MIFTLAAFWLLEFLSHLHPLVVHFPIALLTVAAFLELLTFRGKRKRLYDGIQWMVGLGALSAVLAVAFGLLLEDIEGHSGDWVFYHKWTGVATALLSLLTFWLLVKKTKYDRRRKYRTALFTTVICLTVAGHLGAGLTHGQDYLFGTLPWNQDTEESSIESTAILAGLSGYNDPKDIPVAELDELNLSVRAIFAHNCFQCHSSEKQKGDLVLDTEEGVLLGGETGEILVKGNADGSEIIRRLELPRSDDDAMPPKGKVLKKDEIRLIRKWIDLGAHWSDERLKIFPEAEMALSMPSLPPASGYLTSPIDRIIDAYFDSSKEDWPDTISDQVFLRRASLDITGLLPTLEQSETFRLNRSPEKRRQLVQDLLSNQHAYAQHWLSFWNDLLRNDYSGTGFITGGRKSITPWLYESLLSNVSYDQMVRELLNPSEESEGFIKGILWRGTVNNSQTPQMQAAQNISQSLLGVNLKCASCHNSFVSNLTLDEAYGFASVFSDSLMEINRCDVPTGRFAKPAFLYPELGAVDADSLRDRLVQLSNVVVQPKNGRLYRTLVNRIWAQLFGRGIVSPVDEMDNKPWSQNLLDWLAADFIENGYDLKKLISTIMTSRTYQLASVEYDSEELVRDQQLVFQGPLRRRMTAEQFADAMQQLHLPMYHGIAFDPLDQTSPAKWIWHEEKEVDRRVLPKPGVRYFRKKFSLGSKELLSAKGLVTADHSFELYLNGKRLAGGNDWKTVHQIDLKSELVSGENILAVRGKNEGIVNNPAGLILYLKLIFSDSTSTEIFTDKGWKSSDLPVEKSWATLSYDDHSWPTAHQYGAFKNKHWGQLIDFSLSPNREVIPFARASLVQLDPFLKVLGRPTRENVATSRDSKATLLQAMEFTNGIAFNDVLEKGSSSWLSLHESSSELVDQLFQQALSRKPSQKEKDFAVEMIESSQDEGVKDLLWSILLLPEFQLIF